MLRYKLEIDERTLRELVIDYIKTELSLPELTERDVNILVKSTRSSQWEQAEFKATVEKVV